MEEIGLVYVHKEMKRHFMASKLDRVYMVRSIDFTPQINVSVSEDEFDKLYISLDRYYEKQKRSAERLEQRLKPKKSKLVSRSIYDDKNRDKDKCAEYVVKLTENMCNHGCSLPSKRRIDEFERDRQW